MKPVRHITLKSRQIGLSTFWLLWWLDDCLFNEGKTTGILAHKVESINHLSNIIRTACQYFPDKNMGIVEDNKTRMSFTGNSSMLFSLEIRSTSLTNLHISEWCFCDNDRIWATIGATNKWTNISGESTGNGIGNDGYMTYMDAKEGKNNFRWRFIPWYEHEEYKLPLNGLAMYRAEQRELKAKMSQEQIHFRRQMMSRLKNAFFIEYPEEEEDAFAQSGVMFFDNKKIITLAREARSSKTCESTDLWDIWEYPIIGHRYVIGADTAEGIDGDYSVFKIMCMDCRQEAMRYRGHVRIDQFYRDLDFWGRRYHNALMAVERNNHGHAVLLGLRENCQYPNLFVENPDTRIFVKTNARRPEIKYGWNTTLTTKTIMLDQFKVALEGEPEEDAENFHPDFTVHDQTLLSECLTFQRDGVKLSAISGKHDDVVMASAIAFQMYLKNRHRSTSGLPQGKVLTGAERQAKT